LHDTPRDTLFEDSSLQNWLGKLDLSITVERIQAKKTTNIGHLLGYHAVAVNAENLANALEMQPAINGISIDVRAEFVRFGNKKTTAQRITEKVLQIYTSWNSAS
jgi:hypothetical protein